MSQSTDQNNIQSTEEQNDNNRKKDVSQMSDDEFNELIYENFSDPGEFK